MKIEQQTSETGSIRIAIQRRAPRRYQQRCHGAAPVESGQLGTRELTSASLRVMTPWNHSSKLPDFIPAPFFISTSLNQRTELRTSIEERTLTIRSAADASFFLDLLLDALGELLEVGVLQLVSTRALRSCMTYSCLIEGGLLPVVVGPRRVFLAKGLHDCGHVCGMRE